MWKIITGIAVVALAAFFLLRHDGNQNGEQPGQEAAATSLSGMSADTQASSSAASQRTESNDDAVQPRFTSYEGKPAKRITKSTTGTIVVFPDGRRSPPR